MKQIKMKVREHDVPSAQEYMADSYPESGLYRNVRMGGFFFVNKSLSAVNFVSETVLTATIEGDETSTESGVDTNDLIKILAVAIHRDAAVAALAGQQ